MSIIRVHEIINSAFSQEKAIILRERIAKIITYEQEIVLDFEGITKFTTLFFNFSTGYFVSILGPKEYDKKIKLVNLTELGKSVYESSYLNAVTKYAPCQDIQDEITNIIKNPEE